MNLRDIAKKLIGLFVQKEEEILIPEEWTKPGGMDMTETSNPTPVAVEPIIVFEEPSKSRVVLRLPWLLSLKRVIAFILLAMSVVSIYGFATSYSVGLLFYVPAAIIFLDYLIKTRPQARRKWYILDDLEEEKQ